MTEDSVLETLRRVPDRIVMAVMGREISLPDSDSCLCAWFIREKLAEMRSSDAAKEDSHDTPQWFIPEACSALFGGPEGDWRFIFNGVDRAEELPAIERAFVRRVDEACGFAAAGSQS